MTEAEWLAGTDPWAMLNHLSRKGLLNDRKLRLFAVACCRRVWFWLEETNFETALTRHEQLADGLIVEEAAHRGLQLPYFDSRGAPITTDTPGWSFALDVVRIGKRDVGEKELAKWASLLRDVFGPLLFRPITIDTSLLKWNDGTVHRIAQGMYDDKAFARMSVLADALLDAGCENEEILHHCREQEQVHVRGCWVLDLLLDQR